MRTITSGYIDVELGYINEDNTNGIQSYNNMCAHFYAFNTIERVEVLMTTGTEQTITS